MKKISITGKNIAYLSQDLIIYTVIIFIFELLLFYYFRETFLFLSLLILLVYLFTILIPLLVLFFNYFKYDKNVQVIVTKESLIINEKKIERKFMESIIIIATYQHFNEYKGATSLAYNDYFYYIKIVTKQGNSFYLTSLLDYKIDTILKTYYPEIPIIEKIKSFPLISEES